MNNYNDGNVVDDSENTKKLSILLKIPSNDQSGKVDQDGLAVGFNRSSDYFESILNLPLLEKL